MQLEKCFTSFPFTRILENDKLGWKLTGIIHADKAEEQTAIMPMPAITEMNERQIVYLLAVYQGIVIPFPAKMLGDWHDRLLLLLDTTKQLRCACKKTNKIKSPQSLTTTLIWTG